MRKVVINPLTRISGFLEIEAKIEENTITDAKSSGMMFRGFEKMLEGRYPLDATYFTERICGICSTAHSVASTLALENALNIVPSFNDLLIRDFMHGAEHLQNHLRHFYLYTFPDFVDNIPMNPAISTMITDYRLPDHLNKKLANHYIESIEFSRLSHKLIAILGGKAPHNHGIFVGGVSINFDASIYIELKSILHRIKEFVENEMIGDIEIISKYYEEYFYNGRGDGNFLSYGLFSKYDDEELVYVKEGVFINNKLQPFEKGNIIQSIDHAWYKGLEEFPPLAGEDIPDVHKEDAYSFVKAPRYKGYSLETGPLARQWISGKYRRGISTMDRMIARVLETKQICNIMMNILERIEPSNIKLPKYEIPNDALGYGFTDTTRGALSHYLRIKDKVIEKYTIITPTAWNLSPMDGYGVHGVIEKALIGTIVTNDVVEIGRIVRSFDPCVSCATHVISKDYKDILIRVV